MSQNHIRDIAAQTYMLHYITCFVILVVAMWFHFNLHRFDVCNYISAEFVTLSWYTRIILLLRQLSALQLLFPARFSYYTIITPHQRKCVYMGV